MDWHLWRMARKNSSDPQDLCPPSAAKTKTMYMYGSLANIADDEGRVFVFFDDVSPPAPFKEIP